MEVGCRKGERNPKQNKFELPVKGNCCSRLLRRKLIEGEREKMRFLQSELLLPKNSKHLRCVGNNNVKQGNEPRDCRDHITRNQSKLTRAKGREEKEVYFLRKLFRLPAHLGDAPHESLFSGAFPSILCLGIPAFFQVVFPEEPEYSKRGERKLLRCLSDLELHF